jgi:hypothetical protein
MRNTLIAVVAIIILALVAGLAWNRSRPDTTPIDVGTGVTPGTGTAVQTEETNVTRLIQEIEGKWATLGAPLTTSLGFSPANGQWFLDAAQAIGRDNLLVQFEDGHSVHVAVVHYENNSFRVLKTYPNQGSFAPSTWNQILGEYGSSGYPVVTFSRNSIQNGQIVSYPALTQVPENVFVKQ